MTRPLLSIVVVGHDMARELPRTVQSFLPPYQRGLADDDIEIILVDSRSHDPVRREWFPADAPITTIRVDEGGLSPCLAINTGAAAARADKIAVVIDGARMASPGLVKTALEALSIDEKAFVATIGLHLGPKAQQVSVTEGYSREVEDRLLADIGWPNDGYRLFEISALGGSYIYGLGMTPPETTFFVMSRARFNDLGGYDERFQTLGGGFANFDFFERATDDPRHPLVMLIGEGTFHQLHYGATTQAGGIDRPVEDQQGGSLGDQYRREYEMLRGKPHAFHNKPMRLYGGLTHPAVRKLFFPPGPGE